MRVLLHALIFIGFGMVLTARATEKELEMIPDVDLGFLLSQPKFPWGDDPFAKQPGFAQVPEENEKFALSGILFSRKFPMAVVNGKAVQEGDSVGSRMVKRIGANYVILKKQDSEIELSLPPVASAEPDAEDDSEEESP